MSLPPEQGPRRFLRPFAGEAVSPPPIWLMRQAGRYLPEYRAVRTKAGGFLDLCYTPALAAEVTLQPIRRFGFDAAILFSDILVVPDALGQKVAFVEGEGPRLDPVRSAVGSAALEPGRDSAQVRARQRNGREVAAGSAAGDGAHRLLRRAVDGGELHGGGAGLARPARGEAVGISRSRWIWTIDRSAGRGVDRVPVGPSAGRCRRAADFRYMGGGVAAGGVRGVGGGADPADRERGSRQASKGADHRLSAGSGGQDRTVRGGDGRARRGLRHGHGGRADAGRSPNRRVWWCRETSIHLRSLPAERRSSDRQSDY